MKGAQHPAKRSSVDDSASVPVGEHVPSTLTEAQVSSVCITYDYTQEIFLVRINLKDWSATLGPVVSICFLRWVAHMCRETDRGSRTAGDSRMQKGRKQLLPCLGRSAQHRFPVRRKFIPAITWFLFSFGLSFFEDFCLFVLSLILQFGFILNIKHNLILQALRCVITTSHWLVRHCFSVCPMY